VEKTARIKTLAGLRVGDGRHHLDSLGQGRARRGRTAGPFEESPGASGASRQWDSYRPQSIDEHEFNAIPRSVGTDVSPSCQYTCTEGTFAQISWPELASLFDTLKVNTQRPCRRSTTAAWLRTEVWSPRRRDATPSLPRLPGGLPRTAPLAVATSPCHPPPLPLE